MPVLGDRWPHRRSGHSARRSPGGRAGRSAQLLGATGRFAVHLCDYATPDPAQTRDWAAGFETGYGVGVGVERVGDFDAFEPVAPMTMELIVDDLANIDFVS